MARSKQRPPHMDDQTLLAWMLQQTASESAPYGLEKPCLLWQRGRNKAGYGYTAYGEGHHTRLAHRIVKSILSGIPLSEIVAVCHHCDRPACIEPSHLEIGTISTNVQHMMERGRHKVLRGAKNPGAKLTEQDVLAIRILPMKLREIASLYGVKQETIEAVRYGRCWNHVTAEEYGVEEGPISFFALDRD
jgi:hypothetical protein